ncbi:hypothetical protein [Rathayibacter sp. Leaf296]|uniref:hypothetical protein n=1 Tax=Rathayibacter sp. Leaf296 TaxID=1736327 RepID=UPI0007035EF0|nr:hypothetical protein [Rathayibacter sp. Leaf296]KQQ08781.1 hypothetical protein ASF46_16195 [Rathayibacter sp. Leaf296]
MTGPEALPETTAVVSPTPADRLRAAVADTYERGVLLIGLGVPISILVVLGKIALTVAAPSLFLFANVLVTAAVAVSRVLVFRAHHSRRGVRADFAVQRRLYRVIGRMIAISAVLYTAASAWEFVDDSPEAAFPQPIALALAVIALTELTFAIVGTITARRQRALLLEAARLANIAAALVLLVLAQTALLSLVHAESQGRIDAVSGIVMGSAAALIGIGMLVRSRIPRGRFSPDPLERARLDD